jgi:putative hydrolase of the HAD superfamily
MARAPILAVLFDMGGTLEEVYYDDRIRLDATPGLLQILVTRGLNPGLSIAELYGVVAAGMTKYGEYRAETERELSPEQVWTQFIFADLPLPADGIISIAEELAFYYDTCFFERKMRPEAPALLQKLHDHGLKLGVISNIYSRGQVPYNLNRYGLLPYFQTVVMSSVFGWHKPNAGIFLEGSRQLGVSPAQCAYVGDAVSRDVRGAQHAGYGRTIQIKSFLTTKVDSDADSEQPDAIIQNLMQVAELVG